MYVVWPATFETVVLCRLLLGEASFVSFYLGTVTDLIPNAVRGRRNLCAATNVIMKSVK